MAHAPVPHNPPPQCAPTCNNLTKEQSGNFNTQKHFVTRHTLLTSRTHKNPPTPVVILRFNYPVYVIRLYACLTFRYTHIHTLAPVLCRLDDDMLCFPPAVTGSLLTGNYPSRLLSWPPYSSKGRSLSGLCETQTHTCKYTDF